MKADSIEEFENKYGPENNPEAWVQRMLVNSRYEFLGVMLKKDMVDSEILFQLYKPNTILQAWDRFKPSIMSLRFRFNDPDYNSGFEYLFNETRRRYPNIIHN